MGRIQLQTRTVVVAIATMTAALASANTLSQQHYAKGLLPFHAGKWESAYTSFSNAANADPSDAVALYYRGVAGSRLGFTQKSIADLERALQLRPDLEEAVLDLGVLYLEAGEYERAESWLTRAYKIPENRFRAALFLGITNYRRGDDKAAQEYLRTAAKNPRIRPSANYYEGLSLLRQGKGAPAQRLMANSRRALPDSDFANAVAEYQGSAPPIYQGSDDKPWSVYGDLGFAYDSNVALAPDSNLIKNSRGIGSESAGRAQLGLGAAYRVLDTEMFVGTIGYDLYQDFNFGESDFDLSSHRLRFDVSTRPDRWYQFGLSTFYNYYAFDIDFHEGTAVPWVVFYEGDVAATQIYYRLRARDFSGVPFDPFRDAINNGIGIRQMFLLGAVDRAISVGYQWSDNDPLSSDGTDFAYMSHQFDIEVEAAVRDWFNTRLGYAVVIDDYEHPNSRTGFRFGRNDTQQQIVIHIDRPITQYLTAGLDYYGILNHSNLNEFEYDRHIVSAGVRMSF